MIAPNQSGGVALAGRGSNGRVPWALPVPASEVECLAPTGDLDDSGHPPVNVRPTSIGTGGASGTQEARFSFVSGSLPL